MVRACPSTRPETSTVRVALPVSVSRMTMCMRWSLASLEFPETRYGLTMIAR